MVNHVRKPRRYIYAGEKMGRLTAVEPTEIRTTSGTRKWVFRCDCGNEITVTPGSVRYGNTRSCGCLQSEAAVAHNLRHGRTGTTEYRIWQNMLTRCENPNNPAFKNYGGRGIQVCERWQNFTLFFADMGPRPSPELTLDRIDNERGYEPGNCRWATREVQVLNRRGLHLVTYKGETMAAMVACRKYAVVHPETARGRIKKGWDIAAALETPTIDRGWSLRSAKQAAQ